RQIDYVRGSVSPTLRHTPVEYAQMGRVFCGIDFSEGIELTRAVIDLLGDHVLMFESDYPHPETIFPDHADTVIAWRQSLGERATQKLMWENAARFFRLTSPPWYGCPPAPPAGAARSSTARRPRPSSRRAPPS